MSVMETLACSVKKMQRFPNPCIQWFLVSYLRYGAKEGEENAASGERGAYVLF